MTDDDRPDVPDDMGCIEIAEFLESLRRGDGIEASDE